MVCGAKKEAFVEQARINKFLPIVILFLLATTMFNTMRATRVDHESASFRIEARRQLATTREALKEQQQINVRLEQKLDRLLAEQGPAEPAE
jgi:hypothetical protein